MHLLALLVVSFCASVHAFQRIHHTQRSRKNHKVLISLPETQLRRDEIKCSTRLSFSEVDDNTEDDTKSVRKSGRHLALDDYAQIIEALRIYKKNFNDLDIPVKFEVPAEDPWPSAIHGLRLGKRLQKLFLSSDFFEKHTEKVAEIESIGLVPSVDSLVDDWFMIYKALQTYKDLYGDTRVSAKFVVPAEDPWPKVCHNLKLGTRIAAVRSAGRYVKDRPERKAQLEAMGFEWRIRDHTHKQLVGEELFEQVFQALIIYKKNVSEKLNVPVNFTVPNEGPWPQDMWGLQLGVIVRGIREENKLVYGHANRVQRLNELGFPWEETTREVYSKNRFEVIISALLVYEGMYGDMYVPQSFVVPEESPWPESSWGVKLGARVNAIRSQGTFVSNSPERRFDD